MEGCVLLSEHGVLGTRGNFTCSPYNMVDSVRGRSIPYICQNMAMW